MPVPEELCRCGHARGLHDHLRRGTDCAECGAQRCGSYRAVGVRGRGRVLGVLSRLVPRRTEPGVVLPYRAKGARGRADAPPRTAEADAKRTGSGDVSKEA